MWAYESVFYQIYPLGFCGAPFENDGVLEHRITKIAAIKRGIIFLDMIYFLWKLIKGSEICCWAFD